MFEDNEEFDFDGEILTESTCNSELLLNFQTRGNDLRNSIRLSDELTTSKRKNESIGDISIFQSSIKTPRKAPVKTIVRRKFPGPAGLLPKKDDAEFSILENIDFHKSDPKGTEDILCSQATGAIFHEGVWAKMRKDFSPNSPDELYLPDKYNIQWIKSRASKNKLINQKAPFLAAILQSINYYNSQIPNINVTLKDRTGEIQGTLLHELYEEYIDDITIGSVIVLKQIGVLNTGSTRNNPYLTITHNNLITIYTNNTKSFGNSDVDNVCQDECGREINNRSCKEGDNQHESSFNIKRFPTQPCPKTIDSDYRIINIQYVTPREIIDNLNTVRSEFKLKQHKLQTEKKLPHLPSCKNLGYNINFKDEFKIAINRTRDDKPVEIRDNYLGLNYSYEKPLSISRHFSAPSCENVQNKLNLSRSPVEPVSNKRTFIPSQTSLYELGDDSNLEDIFNVTTTENIRSRLYRSDSDILTNIKRPKNGQQLHVNHNGDKTRTEMRDEKDLSQCKNNEVVNSSQISVMMSKPEHANIWEDAFDGIDPSVLDDDF